jgi:hypothetical protein
MPCARLCCETQAEHYRSLSVLGRIPSKPRVKEGKDAEGHRFKAVTDELNNTVTQRHGDRQDVIVRPDLPDLLKS